MVNGSDVYAGTDGGIFFSSNNGTSWTLINSNLQNVVDIQSLTMCANILFAGVNSSGVWYRPISEIGVLNSSPRKNLIPQDNLKVFTANRSNPNATIQFSLPSPSRVSLTVFNLSGHEVASLVNSALGSGTHSIHWNTRNLAPGCYTVRLRAGSNTYVKSVPLFH